MPLGTKGARGAESGVKIAPLRVPVVVAVEEGGRRCRRGGCASAALPGGRECHEVCARRPRAAIRGWIAAARSEYQNDAYISPKENEMMIYHLLSMFINLLVGSVHKLNIYY